MDIQKNVWVLFVVLCLSFAGVYALTLDKVSSMFNKVFQGFEITQVGQISYPGDTFQHTFVLTNSYTKALPDTDTSDGEVIYLYKAYRMLDQAGNKIQENYEEITTTLSTGATTSLSVSLPIQTTTPSGSYAVSAVLFAIPMTWDRATNTWSEGAEILVDKQAIQFEVQTPTPPPKPSVATILSKIGNIFTSIWNWIRSLFGW